MQVVRYKWHIEDLAVASLYIFYFRLLLQV